MKRFVLLMWCFSFVFLSSLKQVYATNTITSEHLRVIRLASLRDFFGAKRQARQLQDDLLIKLVDWIELTDTKTTPDFEEAKKFIKENPDWPRIYLVRRNAEKAVLEIEETEKIEAWFEKYPPVSVEAVLAYADILLKKKEWEKALPILHALWGKGELSVKEEKSIEERIPFLLDETDYLNRTETLLNEKKIKQAKRFLPFLSSREAPLIQARMDLIARQKKAFKNIKGLPEEQQENSFLLFDAFSWLKRNKKDEDAFKFLKKTPPESQIGSSWWRLKTTLIQDLLNKHSPKKAYEIVKDNSFEEGNTFAEAEWIAGWIALEKLHKPAKAREHFEKMLEKVNSSVSISRGQYWLARSYESMGKEDLAGLYYKKAAEHRTTIYGQLASKEINTYQMPEFSIPDEKIVLEEIKKLKVSELYIAMKMLEKAKQKELVDLFSTRLFFDLKTKEKRTALATLAVSDLNRPDIAVFIARRARLENMDIGDVAYPVKEIKAETKVEKALILAIIRQESSFFEGAESPVGARGLMQIMPTTAREMARKKRKRYSLAKLTTDPEYNIALGSAYFEELLRRFDGSYILSIAAYNAGPTNVNRWIKILGKPKGKLDSINWIESIPFAETRNYVQRVLENLYIYRLALKSEKTDWAL